jgi:hypothetical protein
MQVYMEALGGTVKHYHDDSGAEIDAILELDGRWAAVEIKLGPHRADEAAASLIKLQARLSKHGMRAPSFLAVVVSGGFSHTRDDGVHVIPLDLLGV